MWVWLALALIILLADQFTKVLIVGNYQLGGAVGNLVDRVLYGYVVDFLDFHWSSLSPMFQGGHFPAFNIADSAISIGAVCLIWDELRRVKKSK